MKKFTLLLVAICLSLAATAQLETPAPSPVGTISQKVGLTEVKIEYSRPSAKGRVVFGKLVPFGEMWRTGANASTKITIGADCNIEGQKLAKGTYAIYVIPTADAWEVIFNKNLTLWGTDGYKQEEDALRVKVKTGKAADRAETFTMDIINLTNNGCDLVFLWDNTKTSVHIGLNTDDEVMAAIKRTMDGPSAGSYARAAQYYADNGKDLKQALAWMDKALAMDGEKYWWLRQKSLMQAGLNDYKGATATAQRSIELAKADNDAHYVQMNEDSIAEWAKKK